MAHRVAVIGAGSWGTALAIQLARSGSDVVLWGRDSSMLNDMRNTRKNERYLPGAEFPDKLQVEADWNLALEHVSSVLVSVPSHAFRQVLQQLHASESSRQSTFELAWATKGLEMETGLLPHQVVHSVFPQRKQIAVLSGPTFAREVGQGLPTAITVASTDTAFANDTAGRLSDTRFRAYTTNDITGVEIGGAVKNALAIGAGLSDGLGFGANARVALITRGLREMMRLGVAMGAQADTFMGLAGMGDLVLTCTDNQSRNRRMGLALASGKTVSEAEAEIQQVVEGVSAAKAVHAKARSLGIELPIVEQIDRVITDGVDPREAVEALLARALRSEAD